MHEMNQSNEETFQSSLGFNFVENAGNRKNKTVFN